MLAKTGLLIISNPNQIGKLLFNIETKVQNTLYIHLLSNLKEPFGSYHSNIFNTWPKYSNTILKIYTQAAECCQSLDVRVLLSGIKYKNLQSLKTDQAIDLVIFDKQYHDTEIDIFMKKRIANLTKDCNIITIENSTNDVINPVTCECDNTYAHTVLGGTFDRLHIAHKLLLTEAVLRSTKKVTVGVTEENMLSSKILHELIEPTSHRIEKVKEFLNDVCPELESNVVPITDAYGPTQNDPTMDLLIVSAETMKGGAKVNEVRSNNGLKPLEIFTVNIIEEPNPQPNEEMKISSSTQRMRLLGTLINTVKPNSEIPPKPYVIGLTGGIGSGKTNISKRLEQLGAHVIDCDKLAHQLYEPGKICYKLVVDAFGTRILSENGQIDRKQLGSIVFQDKDQLQKLNSLVWPAIADALRQLIKDCNKSVVVVEAAVLLTAGWEHNCHEVWSSFIQQDEAVKRLMSRNNLTEEQAKARINSQPNNKFYIQSSNVVFCSYWPKEYTWRQVDRAWGSLQERIPSK